MELPVINHEDYFAKIGDDHKFPINKFGELANYLINKKIVKKFHTPYPCSEETLKRAHSENYIKNVKNKTLDQNTIKKIENNVTIKKLNTFPNSLIVSGENWHLGVLGIVASRLKDKYYRPSFVLSSSEGKQLEILKLLKN